MIINRFISTYLLLSLLSLMTGLGALVVAWWVKKALWAGQPIEEQHELEKKLYLVLSLIGLGFAIRLILVPLWFLTLQSMIASVPGAMCLYGVHQIRSPISWISTGLKILLPFIYGFWLVMDHLDRRVESHPFRETKLVFLFPLGLIMLVESSLDLRFLFTVPPRQVSCCTSFFDAPPDVIPEIFTQTSWLWVKIWFILTLLISGVGAALYFFKKKKPARKTKTPVENRPVAVIQLVFVMAALASFFLALHTKISPLFLHLPFHHCIFCLWQEVWDAPLFTALILIGYWSFATYSGITFLKKYKRVGHEIRNSMTKLLGCSTGCLVTGMAILTFHIILI